MLNIKYQSINQSINRCLFEQVIRQEAASPSCHPSRRPMHSSAACAGQFGCIRYVAVGRHMSPSQVLLPAEVSGPHVIRVFVRLRRVSPTNGISIGSAVFAQLTRVPNTDRQTTLRATVVVIGRNYALRANDAALKCPKCFVVGKLQVWGLDEDETSQRVKSVSLGNCGARSRCCCWWWQISWSKWQAYSAQVRGMTSMALVVPCSTMTFSSKQYGSWAADILVVGSCANSTSGEPLFPRLQRSRPSLSIHQYTHELSPVVRLGPDIL